jgi:hypothetical protein
VCAPLLVGPPCYRRYWTKGPRKGQADTLIDMLPGTCRFDSDTPPTVTTHCCVTVLCHCAVLCCCANERADGGTCACVRARDDCVPFLSPVVPTTVGFPDGISRSADGNYWLCLVAPLSPLLQTLRLGATSLVLLGLVHICVFPDR